MNSIARKRKYGGKTQSINEHLKNTARIASYQLRCIGLEHLGRFTALSHDAGKLSDEFGYYLMQSDHQKRGTVNHSAAGALYIYHKYYNESYKKRDPVVALTAQTAINAIYCHHMRLYDCISPQGENVYQKRMDSKNNCGYDEIMRVFFETVMTEADYDDLFEKSRAEVEIFIKKAKKFKNFGAGMMQKLVYSALIDADRYDAYCFEADTEPIASLNVHWETMEKSLENKLRLFKKKTLLDRMRSYISDQCFEAPNRGDGIYRLTVPTGAGKTLAALRFALNAAKEKQRIFYIVPYTTILDQTYDEFVKICGEENITEHHSGVIIEDDDIKHQIYTERWTAPIILTTFVQFMNSLYAGKPSCARRMNSLCNSVLIFDEVQSMPREVVGLFTEAINFLVDVCECTVLLCTATQPTFESLKYHPILLTDSSDIVSRTDDEYVSAFKRVRIINMYSNEGMSCEGIAEFACEKLKTNRSMLIVMNTVSEAKRVYDYIDGDFKKIYLSTKKCRATRMRDIEEIKQHTKALCNGEIDEKLVVVSTQLVEAGVDISFECGIRALAGIDNLVQTAGRCGRNGEFGHICDVYSINIKDENLSRLSDIDRAKRCAVRVLSELDEDTDLLSADVIKRYYGEYFKVNESRLNELEYICGKSTLYEMLSDNKKYVNEYKSMHAIADIPVLRQSFETAGRKFTVIKNDTESIIVPCDDTAREYISYLANGCNANKTADIIKRCSKYTVNMYRYEMEQLKEKNALYFIESKGIWVLAEGFYNDEYGVTADGELEFMSC